MKPRVIGLLSWYDELPEFLVTTIKTAAPLLDHLVAVDGRYAHFQPDSSPSSDLDQYAAIAHTCRELGIGLSLHVPTQPWASEVEKRSAMFRYAEVVADVGKSWYWVLDGDGFTTQLDITPDEVIALDQDAAEVTFVDPAEKTTVWLRNLFRALPGLRCGPLRHYDFRTDDLVLWGAGQVDAANLTDRIKMVHANHLRDPARRQAGQDYYALRDRDDVGLERGPCERCHQSKAVRAIPTNWRRATEGPMKAGLVSDYIELCPDCIHPIRVKNRKRLAYHGATEEISVIVGAQRFQLRDIYWHWSHRLKATGWKIPRKVAERYDALLEDGKHQKAGELIEPHRPPRPTPLG